jgi:uncharacterized protein (DUF2267 family)
MTREPFLRAVRDRAALETEAEASQVATLVLRALAPYFAPPLSRALGRDLPDPFSQELTAHTFAAEARGDDTPLSPDALYERVARSEHVQTGFALEHTQAVCQVVGEVASAEAHTLLRHHLPRSVAELFEPRSFPDNPPPHLHHSHRRARSLAEARAGSRRPVSEAGPSAGAHPDSVAKSEDPHAETKLSSSRGMTQEREHESLSEGQEGSSHPLSDGEG